MHEWNVKTAYYNAKVPIWIDEIADSVQWREEFMKPEAKEVVEAVGAYVYCFRLPANGEVSEETERVMRGIQDVSEEHAGYGADTIMLAAALPPANSDAVKTKSDDWEDICIQYGFEFINYAAEGKNEYGEKVGFERLKEALEANEWSASDEGEDDLDLDDLDFDADDDFGGFNKEEAEMTAELFGMKAALSGNDDFEPEADDLIPQDQQSRQVDSLDRMMGKLLAVKEQSADLPEPQRKKIAAQAVKDLMKVTDV